MLTIFILIPSLNRGTNFLLKIDSWDKKKLHLKLNKRTILTSFFENWPENNGTGLLASKCWCCFSPAGFSLQSVKRRCWTRLHERGVVPPPNTLHELRWLGSNKPTSTRGCWLFLFNFPALFLPRRTRVRHLKEFKAKMAAASLLDRPTLLPVQLPAAVQSGH